MIYKNIDLLLDLFKTITGIVKYNNKNIITFCPKCERDRFFSSKNHGHLYLDLYSPIFNCFRCPYSGIAIKLFNEFNLDINNYLIEPISDNNIGKYMIKNNEKGFVETNLANISIDNKIDNSNAEKIEYLKTRLRITEEQILKIPGIVLDVYKFYESNNIQILEKYKYFDLSRYVGVLTNNRSILSCRTIDTNYDKNRRYLHLRLDERKYFFKEHYGIELNPNGDYIILCEGTFDLLNSLYNKKILKEITRYGIYISTALTNNYKSTIISTLNYLKMPMSNFLILSDIDVNLDYYKSLKFYSPFIKSLCICYNTAGKDFGEHDITITRYNLK